MPRRDRRRWVRGSHRGRVVLGGVDPGVALLLAVAWEIGPALVGFRWARAPDNRDPSPR